MRAIFGRHLKLILSWRTTRTFLFAHPFTPFHPFFTVLSFPSSWSCASIVWFCQSPHIVTLRFTGVLDGSEVRSRSTFNTSSGTFSVVHNNNDYYHLYCTGKFYGNEMPLTSSAGELVAKVAQGSAGWGASIRRLPDRRNQAILHSRGGPSIRVWRSWSNGSWSDHWVGCIHREPSADDHNQAEGPGIAIPWNTMAEQADRRISRLDRQPECRQRNRGKKRC